MELLRVRGPVNWKVSVLPALDEVTAWHEDHFTVCVLIDPAQVIAVTLSAFFRLQLIFKL